MFIDRSGWSGNVKGYKGEPTLIKVDQNKTRTDLNSLAICKEIAKIDVEKLSQREVSISLSLKIYKVLVPII